MNEIIERVRKFLEDNNFNNDDYAISLQGPTVFFSINGQIKLEEKPKIIDELNLIINS